MFLGFSIAPFLIGLGIAKSTPSNRKKPITSYFNGALVVTWIVVLIGLYGGWYGNKRVNEYYEKKPEIASSDFNSTVKKMVDEIVVQLPIQINKNTYLTSAIYLNNSVYYYYILDSEVDKVAFHREMNTFVHNRFCTDPDMEIFIKYAKNIRVHWEYTNTQGIVLSNISMIASDCKL